MRVYRKNIYKPVCIIDFETINRVIGNFKPDSMVFFSSKSVITFMDNCSTDILNYIAGMQLFALGTPTSKILKNYSTQGIIKPKYPDIYTLSDLIYKARNGRVFNDLDEKPIYYVFNINETEGYIIISGDDKYGLDKSLINSIRRILLTDIPTIAFKIDETGEDTDINMIYQYETTS